MTKFSSRVQRQVETRSRREKEGVGLAGYSNVSSMSNAFLACFSSSCIDSNSLARFTLGKSCRVKVIIEVPLQNTMVELKEKTIKYRAPCLPGWKHTQTMQFQVAEYRSKYSASKYNESYPANNMQKILNQ